MFCCKICKDFHKLQRTFSTRARGDLTSPKAKQAHRRGGGAFTVPGMHRHAAGEGRLTSPVRLGLLLTEEATELMELRDEAEGLRVRLAGVVAITRLTAAALALAGVVEGKPILVTLWTGANRPYLG